jgi:hypothetical protein
MPIDRSSKLDRLQSFLIIVYDRFRQIKGTEKLLNDLPPLDDQPSPEEALHDIQELSDSPTGNLIGRLPPPSHVVTFQLQPPAKKFHLLDPLLDSLLTTGTPLPPPKNGPSVFIKTTRTTMMDEVIHNLLQAGIIRPDNSIINAFRLFLVAKPSGAARPILDHSPWTTYYTTPPMRLYSSAQVPSERSSAYES